MDTIREFMVSSSGLAPARRGLGLGWVISALSGIAILLGAKEAKADDNCDWEEDSQIDCYVVSFCPNDRPWYCCDQYDNWCCTT